MFRHLRRRLRRNGEPHERMNDPASPIVNHGCNSAASNSDDNRASASLIPDDDDSSSDSNTLTNSTCSSTKRMMRKSSSVVDDFIELRKEGSFASKMVPLQPPLGIPIEEVYDGVHTGPILGKGVSGIVRRVTHRATGHQFAVKCLELSKITSVGGLIQLREEIAIMCELDHPNIVRLDEVYESNSQIFLVQELCTGGDLFDRLDDQPDEHYTEAECARMVKQMLSAVRYLHLKGIIHRDLKLENWLYLSDSPDSELVLIDFGLSKHFELGQIHRDTVGTLYSCAPEVINGSYDERCDVWSLGVITYLLLSGDAPFGGCGGPEPLKDVISNILAGSFVYAREEAWSIVSHEAKSFIETMLVVDPQKRPTAEVAQNHRWLYEWARFDRKDDNVLSPDVARALLAFKGVGELRKLLSEVLSYTLLPEQLKDIRKEFEKIDDGTGEVSLASLKHVLTGGDARTGSSGALTDIEVEEIFNAMRVGRTESRVHYHEFIAASLSQCPVDERNLRLAFDRLDNDHNGFLTYENVRELLESDDESDGEALKRTWDESLMACNCRQREMLTYQEFSFLMSSPNAGENVLRDESIGVHQFDTPKLRKSREMTHSLQAVDETLLERGFNDTHVPELPQNHKHRRSLSVGDSDDRNYQGELSEVPLVVNRTLFHANRQLRLAVLEASEQFETQRAQRAFDALATQAVNQDGSSEKVNALTGAGLVLRRGNAKKRVDSDFVRTWIRETELKQEALVSRARKRSGRGPRLAKVRSYSDISGMVGGE